MYQMYLDIIYIVSLQDLPQLENIFRQHAVRGSSEKDSKLIFQSIGFVITRKSFQKFFCVNLLTSSSLEILDSSTFLAST